MNGDQLNARIEFVYDEHDFQTLVYYIPTSPTEPKTLLGTVPPAQAQRSQDIFTWAHQRIALLGLPPIQTVS